MTPPRHQSPDDESEAPTRVVTHYTPCEIAKDMLKSHSRLQAFVGSGVGAALIAAGYLYMRQDKAQDRQTAAEVAAASLTVEVRVTMANILDEQRQTKSLLASLYHITPATP